MGLGGDDPAEYDMVGMSTAQRGRRMDDAVPLLVELLGRHSPVERTGHYRTVGPGLERGDGSAVRVLVGGRAPAAHERAAQADGWLAVFCAPKHVAVGAERVRTLSPTATIGYQAWVGVGADGREGPAEEAA